MGDGRRVVLWTRSARDSLDDDRAGAVQPCVGGLVAGGVAGDTAGFAEGFAAGLGAAFAAAAAAAARFAFPSGEL